MAAGEHACALLNANTVPEDPQVARLLRGDHQGVRTYVNSPIGTSLATFINALLSAQADTVCAAEYGTRTPERVNGRNGYRHRDLYTRAGTLDVAVPKLREGPSSRTGC